jgi:capsular polysaccharide export protein
VPAPLLPALVGCPDRLLLTHSTIASLLAPAKLVVGRRRCAREPVHALVAWGRRPSGRVAEVLSQRRGLPLWRLEDAFLRSMDAGPGIPPLGIVLDDLGIHYDATRISRLELLISAGVSDEQRRRAERLASSWRQHRLSKTNASAESPPPDTPFVLVVDQVADDASIRFGFAEASAFPRMLDAALAEFPSHTVVIKTHPDVVNGRRHGHFNANSLEHPRVRLCADGGHPAALLEGADAVYAVTSQMGFEALLWHRPVRTFGMPFYAGWGLTVDELETQCNGRRDARPDLAALVHSCLVSYSRYFNPVTNRVCTPEQLIEHILLQRSCRARLPRNLEVFGTAPWKRRAARQYLPALKPAKLHFRRLDAAPGRDSDLRQLVWGQRIGRGLRQAMADGLVPEPIRVEDGFLRSVGQGWVLRWVPPISWVFDEKGIYYDASRASDLECFLSSHRFTGEERQRAAALRRHLVTLGLTKYNLNAPAWQRPAALLNRPVLLVAGQVESDLSIRYGTPPEACIRSNLELLQAVRLLYPKAFLIYKPHPDVVAARRRPGKGETLTHLHCDLVLPNAPIDQLISAVDEVHVRTSGTGFEAILRGVPVQTWGMPFYAGWGLTTDHLICTRRGRSLSLDELVYGALIYYPRYLSQRSGCFITAEQAVEELAMQRRDCHGCPGSRSILASTPFSISPRVQFTGAQLAARFKDALDGILPDSLIYSYWTRR